MIPDCRPVYTCTKTNMKHSSYRSVGLMGWQLKFLNMTTTLNLSMWFLDFCARRNALKSSCCPLKVHLQVSLSFISWMRVQSAQIELLLKKDNLPDRTFTDLLLRLITSSCQVVQQTFNSWTSGKVFLPASNIYLHASSARRRLPCHQPLAARLQSSCAPNRWSGKSSWTSGCWAPVTRRDLKIR